MIINIKNTTILLKQWGGFDFPPTSSTTIQDVDRLRLLSDPDFRADLLVGNAVVNDQQYDLNVRVGLGVLQNNQIVMNEYYTLTQDDDILVGNGQILYLHDELDYLPNPALPNNVPGY